jgi:hypothetical protein
MKRGSNTDEERSLTMDNGDQKDQSEICLFIHPWDLRSTPVRVPFVGQAVFRFRSSLTCG